jgi:hypothetical protein
MTNCLPNTYWVRCAPETDATVRCPRCGARAKFSRSLFPHIDSCGFECYSLRCECCAGAIAGIIDPHNDELFIPLIDPTIDGTAFTYGGGAPAKSAFEKYLR